MRHVEPAPLSFGGGCGGGEAFAAAVAALVDRPVAVDERLAVAVSGGPDSLALLLLAHRAFGRRVSALTVDHGLRSAAGDEAALVANYAASIGVAHTTLHWVGVRPKTNLQASARDARYRLMGDWCAANQIPWLATAHHQGDQAETLLLRLARGSGSGGLAGIQPRRPLRPGVELLRPLLSATKAELATIVAAAAWTAVDDPSNCDDRFDRSHVRALLVATPWLDPARLAASAAHLADVEAALAWTADLAWRSRVEVIAGGDRVERAVGGPVEGTAGTIVIDAAGLPHDLARRLLVRAVMALVPTAVFRGDGIERILRSLAVGVGGTLAGVAVHATVRNGATCWYLRVAPPRRRP